MTILLTPENGLVTPRTTPGTHRATHWSYSTKKYTSYGPTCGILGAIWAPLQAILGHLGVSGCLFRTLLALSWGPFGSPVNLLGSFGSIFNLLEPPWSHLGTCWRLLDPSWGNSAHLGTIQVSFWLHVRHLWHQIWIVSESSLFKNIQIDTHNMASCASRVASFLDHMRITSCPCLFKKIQIGSHKLSPLASCVTHVASILDHLRITS